MGNRIKINIVILYIFLVFFIACNRSNENAQLKTVSETDAADIQEIKTETPFNIDSSKPQSDLHEIKKFFFTVDDPNVDYSQMQLMYSYNAVTVSRSKMLKDTFEYAKSIGFTGYNNIWYEGKKLCVDISHDIVNMIDAGGSFGSGFILLNLQYTFLSFPDVEELEYYSYGSNGELYASHFSLGGRIINAAEKWKFFNENVIPY